MLKWVLAASGIVALGLASRSASAAQFVVIDAKGSIAAGLKPGAVIDDAAIDVPANDQLTVMGGDGQAIQIDGPHKGSIGQVSEADNGMLTKISQAMQERPAVFGTSRAAGFPPPPVPDMDDPWAVNATMGGTACVFEDHPPALWKPASSDLVYVTIHDEASNKDTSLSWPANLTTQPWPKDLPINDGDRYQVTYGDKHRMITLKKVAAAKSVGLGALYAANAGCTGQAASLLRSVKPARVVPPSNG